jgi:DNA-binding MarR family transcriptional regulator
MPDEGKLVDRLRMVVIRLSRHLRRESQAAGLSVMDTQVLSDVYRIPGIGISELAEIELVSAPAMSLRIKRLLDLGWVSSQSGEDSRRIGLCLTKSGLRAFDQIVTAQNGWLNVQLEGLSDDEMAKLDAAILPLTKLLDRASVDGQALVTRREMEAIDRVRRRGPVPSAKPPTRNREDHEASQNPHLKPTVSVKLPTTRDPQDERQG